MGWKYREIEKWDTTFDELKPGEYFICDVWNTVMLKSYEGYFVDSNGGRCNRTSAGYPYWARRVYPIGVVDGDIIFSEEKPTS